MQCYDQYCSEDRAVVPVWKPRSQAAKKEALQYASLRELWQICPTYIHSKNVCAPLNDPLGLERDSYSIVISTLDQDAALLSVLPHWLGCNNVSSIIVVWHDPTRAIGPELLALQSMYARLTILQQATRKLSNRYLDGMKFKTSAVFSVNDDEWYNSDIMVDAFQVWRENGGDAMVGFNPRRINYTAGSHEAYGGIGYEWNGVCKANYWRESWEPKCGVYNSLFVAKGRFLHRRIHEAYFSTQWKEPRDMVDHLNTADDILMTAVHAAMVPANAERKLVAVSAISRHTKNYYGTLTFEEMNSQQYKLLHDPKSNHFLMDPNNSHTKIRMEVIQTIVEQNLPQPFDAEFWFFPEEPAYIDAHTVCLKDLSAGCHVF